MKPKLTITFNNSIARDLFVASWLDGGGEQLANLNTVKFTKDSMHIECLDEACTECGYWEDAILNFGFDNKHVNKYTLSCNNCNNHYEVKNPYYGTDILK